MQPTSEFAGKPCWRGGSVARCNSPQLTECARFVPVVARLDNAGQLNDARLSPSTPAASFVDMKAEFDLGEIKRLTEKKQRFGEDALTDDELYTLGCFKAFTTVMKRGFLGRTEQQRADRIKGWELFGQLSPEDQERYSEWTPEQFLALHPLLDENEGT